MQIVKYSKLFLIISALIMLPGAYSLVAHGLNLAIDFTGGSEVELAFADKPDLTKIRQVVHDQNIELVAIKTTDSTTILQTKPISADQSDQIVTAISEVYPNTTKLAFETIGPTVGAETTKKAFLAIIVASVAIVLFITYAFRNIPKPYSSYRFGVSAIVAMLHDAFIVLGVFSILGKLYGLEIDSLFITAILTVIGFSIHDTIVVFERIRENLKKLSASTPFSEIVNYSIVETLNRSIATSLTVVITLFSLFMLGGDSIKGFILALLIGIVSGTYSSIFTASPILVYWENYTRKSKN